jgi:hypothetical protein
LIFPPLLTFCCLDFFSAFGTNCVFVAKEVPFSFQTNSFNDSTNDSRLLLGITSFKKSSSKFHNSSSFLAIVVLSIHENLVNKLAILLIALGNQAISIIDQKALEYDLGIIA